MFTPLPNSTPDLTSAHKTCRGGGGLRALETLQRSLSRSLLCVCVSVCVCVCVCVMDRCHMDCLGSRTRCEQGAGPGLSADCSSKDAHDGSCKGNDATANSRW